VSPRSLRLAQVSTSDNEVLVIGTIIRTKRKVGLEMSFLKRLFGREKRTIEPMRGVATGQTEAEQDVTRKRMEAEMTSQRDRRAETPDPNSKDDPPGAAP
jgi:hypothetical protein